MHDWQLIDRTGRVGVYEGSFGSGCFLLVCLVKLEGVLKVWVQIEHLWDRLRSRSPGRESLIHLTVEILGVILKWRLCLIHFRTLGVLASCCIQSVMLRDRAQEYMGHSVIWRVSLTEVLSQEQGGGFKVLMGSVGCQPLLALNLNKVIESRRVWLWLHQPVNSVLYSTINSCLAPTSTKS